MTAATAYVLYLVFALGGVGIYFLLPRGDQSRGTTGAVFGLMALVSLFLVLGFNFVAPNDSSAFFYLFSAISIIGATRVITHPKPVYSAVYFVLVVVAVAAMLVLLRAEFLAVALIIIYAGAILVTYLFVIMLAQQSTLLIYDRQAREPFAAVFAGFLLTAAIAGQVGDWPSIDRSASRTASIERFSSSDSVSDELPDTSRDVGPRGLKPAAQKTNTRVILTQQSDANSQVGHFVNDGDASDGVVAVGNTLAMGRTLMTRYVVVLELAGILLLVSMVGAVAMARKKVPIENHGELHKPIGQIGKEVKPF